jgi:hypothetical protein
VAWIAEVEYLEVLTLMPVIGFLACDQIRDPGITFPPGPVVLAFSAYNGGEQCGR